MPTQHVIILSLALGLLSACGGGADACSTGLGNAIGGSGLCDKNTVNANPNPNPNPNAAPLAVAGADQSLIVGTTVNLDGSKSRDPDGQPITYLWQLRNKPSGSSAALSSTTEVLPTFVVDKPGIYVAQLSVNDGLLDSAIALVTITAAEQNAAPVANPGTNQNVTVSTLVTLDGSFSSDANRDPLIYTWKFESIPSGSTAKLSSATDARPTFTADKAGSYVASLTVSDGQLTSNFTTVTVTASVVNSAPTARISPVAPVAAGQTITLNGAASSDPDRDALTYKWVLISQPSRSNVALSNNASAQTTVQVTTAGNYVASLVVNDGTVNSDYAFITLTALAPPVAKLKITDGNAPITGDIPSGTALTLDASESTDPVNAALTYQWTLSIAPPTNKAELLPDASGKARLTPVEPGDYVINLVVSNAAANSKAVTLLLKVLATPP